MRTLNLIAQEINCDWKNIPEAAVVYLYAMTRLENISDKYGVDSGKSIVLYFLANAQGWKGEPTRRIKAELKAMLKVSKHPVMGSFDKNGDAI